MRMGIFVASALAIVAGISWALFRGSSNSASQAPSGRSLASCVIAGQMQSSLDSKKMGFESLGKMIRLRYSVESLDECKKMTSDYCSTRLHEGYSPSEVIV